MSTCPSVLPQFTDRRSDIEELPLELFEEILSFLDIPSIKRLDLASPVFHATCLPHFFRNLVLHGDRRPAPKFLDDFKGRIPVPCLRKVELESLKEDISADLLPCLSQTVNELNVRRITFLTRTTFPTFLLALLSMHSDDPAPLEELTITFPIRAASNPSVF
ncbi:hypothetical protein EV421DRAFT_1742782 [Armillaria borealis]|uniref:F-box domain-containing protein n=1 Tax=Armillaria borealis TaxID=47425 RepID=A0AA39MEG2_9AGAR|nr:hypothetical protein EV421DRAFT_1742782 [Armillaria borealis]